MSGAGSYRYRYPRPAVTVDLVVFVLGDGGLEVPLVRRGHEPFKDRWALPGGFVDEDEELVDAARRELEEETALRVRTVVQVGAYGEPGRDPRGHSVGVGFAACARHSTIARRLKAGDDARESALWPLLAPPVLAFDHDHILTDAWRVLQREAIEHALVFELLPRCFTPENLARALTAIGPRRVTTRGAQRILDVTPGIARAEDGYVFRRSAWKRTPPE